MITCLDTAEKLAFTIAAKTIGLLINADSAKAKINHPAKLGKKKDEKDRYRNIFFQWMLYKTTVFNGDCKHVQIVFCSEIRFADFCSGL